jgi:hypothetical protein
VSREVSEQYQDYQFGGQSGVPPGLLEAWTFPISLPAGKRRSRKTVPGYQTDCALGGHLQEPALAYLIERALDEARAGAYPLKGQAPYFSETPV